MALRLSSGEIRLLGRAQWALLSSLAFEERKDWYIEAVRAVKELVPRDAATLVLILGSGPDGATDDFDPVLFRALARVGDVGDLEYDHEFRAAVAAGRFVWSPPRGRRRDGERLEDARVHQEFMVPAGLAGGPVLLRSAQADLFDGVPPTGAGMLALGPSSRRGQDGQRDLEILGLLAPAFEAGVRARLRLDAAGGHVLRLLDRVGAPAAAYASDGRELFLSSGLEDVLRGHPAREQLVLEIRELARGVARARRSGGDEGPLSARKALCDVGGRTAHILRAVPAAPGLLGIEEGFVVLVEAPPGSLPTVDDLRKRYGLTRREAEVALLLAEGASNKTIQRRLDIRSSTVRTYTERLFPKLGVHSRKAMGLKLLESAPVGRLTD